MNQSIHGQYTEGEASGPLQSIEVFDTWDKARCPLHDLQP
jgi:hypothetical protein